MKILILGASYGSLLSTKLIMAGHDVTLVCRDETAKLINSEGTVIRLMLRDEDEPRLIISGEMPGNVDAVTPENARPEDYDLIGLAMQEPQYGSASVKALMQRVGASRKPCLSIMNMPPPPYLRRLEFLTGVNLDACYADPSVWKAFEPGLISLCSPDPQAFRPPEEKPNFLHVGLPTNFKASGFEDPDHTRMLKKLEDDIAAVTIDGKDVPVKLRVTTRCLCPWQSGAYCLQATIVV